MLKKELTFIQRFGRCVQRTTAAATTGHLDAAQRYISFHDLVGGRLIFQVDQPDQTPLLLADALRFVADVVVGFLVRRSQLDAGIVLDDLQFLTDSKRQFIFHQTATVMLFDDECTAQL